MGLGDSRKISSRNWASLVVCDITAGDVGEDWRLMVRRSWVRSWVMGEGGGDGQPPVRSISGGYIYLGGRRQMDGWEMGNVAAESMVGAIWIEISHPFDL